MLLLSQCGEVRLLVPPEHVVPLDAGPLRCCTCLDRQGQVLLAAFILLCGFLVALPWAGVARLEMPL